MSVRLKAEYQKKVVAAKAKVTERGKTLCEHIRITRDPKTAKLYGDYLEAIIEALDLMSNKEYE